MRKPIYISKHYLREVLHITYTQPGCVLNLIITKKHRFHTKKRHTKRQQFKTTAEPNYKADKIINKNKKNHYLGRFILVSLSLCVCFVLFFRCNVHECCDMRHILCVRECNKINKLYIFLDFYVRKK